MLLSPLHRPGWLHGTRGSFAALKSMTVDASMATIQQPEITMLREQDFVRSEFAKFSSLSFLRSTNTG